jgi:hypothetical protein
VSACSVTAIQKLCFGGEVNMPAAQAALLAGKCGYRIGGAIHLL